MQKSRISRIRTLYAIFLGVITLCVVLFFMNIISAADPIELSGIGSTDDRYGVIITDLHSADDVYLREQSVYGMPDGLSATAHVRRYDVHITASREELLQSSTAVWCQWLQLGSALAGVAMTLLVVMALISLYINVRRGKIFPTRNITWLTWAGILMIAMSLGIDLSTYLERSLAADLLRGTNWELAPTTSIHMTRIFFGLTIIFLAEIFKIGREMQEEQELTI